jgi:hypothetical protein
MYSAADIIRVMKCKKIKTRCTGQVAAIEGMRNRRKIEIRRSSAKRSLGKRRRSCEYNMNMRTVFNWLRIGSNNSFGYTVMIARVP